MHYFSLETNHRYIKSSLTIRRKQMNPGVFKMFTRTIDTSYCINLIIPSYHRGLYLSHLSLQHFSTLQIILDTMGIMYF